ncbi:MAG: hypothetical protein AVDCRST_MAG67-4526 [uncultured Solirubrobacteraceae bacterium]|uniref:Uncharacterized protein n=1 Tax=uncultured Solirubrobacteraceae bacterium TaxID=1162706 RepID=A0A6J4TVM5_9ACTN|nr:MAG: hypothetical protein AVDCRST_MAG67-4526 [uncultured Solirubrobacteraceae bacterium]
MFAAASAGIPLARAERCAKVCQARFSIKAPEADAAAQSEVFLR